LAGILKPKESIAMTHFLPVDIELSLS